MLGTLITEGDEGKVLCEKLLESVECLEFYADQLALIAKTYNFEGWLLNFENPIPAEDVDYLIRFAEVVTKRTRDRVGEKSLVIWYDSVVDSGALEWQNKLNRKNLMFYAATDGIYLNYNWSRCGLAKSAWRAAKRQRPVNSIFVGVDVFGRGCFGGGGWKTKLAIDEIKLAHEKLSVAIFAPGWVHEVECRHDQAHFFDLNDKYWAELGLSVRHYPKALPFSSTFCRGYGFSKFTQGQQTSVKWSNLSVQRPQPGHCVLAAKYTTEDGLDGGGCLILHNRTSLEFLRVPLDRSISVTLHIKPGEALHSVAAILDDSTRLPLTNNTSNGAKNEEGWTTRHYVIANHGSTQTRTLIGLEFDVDGQLLVGSVCLDKS